MSYAEDEAKVTAFEDDMRAVFEKHRETLGAMIPTQPATSESLLINLAILSASSLTKWFRAQNEGDNASLFPAVFSALMLATKHGPARAFQNKNAIN